MRRTAVRNLVRAGVPQSAAMDISGHKTISIFKVFKRYNITSGSDLAEAGTKLDRYLSEQRSAKVGSKSGQFEEQDSAGKPLNN